MQSGRAALASSGRISGSGLASARMIGWLGHALDHGRRHHAGGRAAEEDVGALDHVGQRARLGLLAVALLDLVELVAAASRTTPLLSHMKMFAGLTPRPTITSRQAMAAAPAPETAILISPIFLPTSSSPLSSAAAEMIAVPCWSSWNTGMLSRSRSFFSM